MRASGQEQTDAVIVGCGIAGGMLAASLSDAGCNTIVLEKRPHIGVPVRCAEAAGSLEELSHFIPIDEAWISSLIKRTRLEGPGGTSIERRAPGVGVVLRRDRFDAALAARAAAAGADIRTHVEVTELEQSNGSVRGVRYYDHASGRSGLIHAPITIGADGVEAETGRMAGLRRHLKPADMHSCCQYVMAGDSFPPETIILVTGTRCAPGGYAWIFPRGEGYANVGIGIHPGKTAGLPAQHYLDRFVAERFPGARITATIAGGTSGIKPLKTMVGDGVLLVGECAGQNNPFSGGGIMNALEGAEEAAVVLLRCFETGDFSRRALGEYDRRWHQRNGRTIAKFAALRKFFMTLEDSDMDTLITLLDTCYSDGERGQIDYPELFKTAILSAPGLLWKARKLLW